MDMEPGAVSEAFVVTRWTPTSKLSAAIAVAMIAALSVLPLFFGANVTERLTTLFVYIILAVMWNALAGYAGLVSVGQQMFFGLGAYATIRLSYGGMNAYAAMAVGALLAGCTAIPLSSFMLRLRGGEFAIATWVIATVAHLLVNFDPLIEGETGKSLIALNAYNAPVRQAASYWATLATMVVFLVLLFVLLRSRVGVAIQAIRDDENAAASVGVRVMAAKRLIFTVAAFGCAAAGALWLATALTFQPRAYFGIQWTAYMLFMALVGGLGTFEGPIIGAVIFFVLEDRFGAAGVWYLVGLGVVATLFSLLLPRGIWGTIVDRYGVQIMPVGHQLGLPSTKEKSPKQTTGWLEHESSDLRQNITCHDGLERKA
jgi:branched-chain amino acid transport system permease protein